MINQFHAKKPPASGTPKSTQNRSIPGGNNHRPAGDEQRTFLSIGASPPTYKTPASVALLAERRGTHLGPTGDAVPVPEEIFVAEERSAYRSADLGAVSCAELFAKVVMLISAVRCAHLGAGGSAVLSAKEGILISAVRCAQLGHLFVLCELRCAAEVATPNTGNQIISC
jgi:hypothetical protein